MKKAEHLYCFLMLSSNYSLWLKNKRHLTNGIPFPWLGDTGVRIVFLKCDVIEVIVKN